MVLICLLIFCSCFEIMHFIWNFMETEFDLVMLWPLVAVDKTP